MTTAPGNHAVRSLIEKLDEQEDIDRETAKAALDSLEIQGVMAALEETRPHLPQNVGDSIRNWTK